MPTTGQRMARIRKLIKTLEMKVDFESPKSVRLYWESGDHLTSEWNEGCARAMELFGLPGDRFVTDLCEDWMYFHFKSEKDATMFVMAVA